LTILCEGEGTSADGQVMEDSDSLSDTSPSHPQQQSMKRAMQVAAVPLLAKGF
jgi:hypothetical protein